MRWLNRLFFVLTFLAVAATARGGASKVCLLAPTSPIALSVELDRAAVFAPLVFAERSAAQISPVDETGDQSGDELPGDSSFTAELTAFGLGNDGFGEQLNVPHHLHMLPAGYFSMGVKRATQQLTTPTTVAIPLPPAAVGGAVIAATLLSRPLLGARRRRAARTFR